MSEKQRYYGDPAKSQAYVDIMHAMSVYQIWLDDGDFEKVGTAFAEDAILEVSSGAKMVGRSMITETLRSRREQRLKNVTPSQVFQRHNLTTRLIEVTGPDTATATSYFFVTTEIGMDHYGRYFDVFSLRNGEWLISRRRIAVDWMHEGSRFKATTGYRASAPVQST